MDEELTSCLDEDLDAAIEAKDDPGAVGVDDGAPDDDLDACSRLVPSFRRIPYEAPRYKAPDKPIGQWTSREVGREGETIAALYLRRRGYEVIARNWRCIKGEADIVAIDGDTHVLVEVKTRVQVGEEDFIPELAVDGAKQRRYRDIGLMYMVENPDVRSVRFDVIAVSIVGEQCARLRHLMAAFSWDD
jgi:putative endonuclease